MIYATLITLFSLLVSLRISKNIFAPATLVSALWLFCILAYQFYPHSLYPLKGQFHTAISIWVAAFTFSSLFTQSIFQKSSNTEDPNKSLRNLYFFISLISFPYVMWNIYSLLRDASLLNDIFYNLRNAALGNINGLEEGTSNNYFAPFWLVAYLIELLHFKKERTWIFIILLIINLSWAFLVMSKMVFLNIFISTLAILFFKKIIKTRILLISLAALFVFFSFFQLMRSTKSEIKDGELRYDFFTQYVLTGMPGFETVKPHSSEYFGQNTLRFFYAVGYETGLSDKKPVNPVLKFIYVDKNKKTYSNVYTTLYPFYKDFGYRGVFWFALLVGIFYGYIFKKASKKDNPMIISYSVFVSLMITQFMNETTFTTMSFLLQILIFSHLPYWINKKVRVSVQGQSILNAAEN